MPDREQTQAVRTGAAFATTLWSVVLAVQTDSPESHHALERLCRAYWRPIYAFLRRDGHAPADAEDFTQGFLASLLARNSLASVGPERGRFRSFLLASLRHYLADQRDRARAAKRGGGAAAVSLDAETAEAFYARQVSSGDTPERCFERQWAQTVLDHAQDRLKAECQTAGKESLYNDLGPQRQDDRTETHAEIGVRHGMSENAVRLAAMRLRRRYQELVREEIGQTVKSEAELEEELRHLLRVLTS